ncbi:hypothetical protein CU098_006653 [Rhizopus stolonifer]|uniref:Uncharacterized protein n=1 Tax=Rhizopus stolonifer TaxID=4846 RepID=A0A367J4Y9_RHIST|nr:hypothetical protein CU098_006653 [Rhizopus stolonifer]
MSIIKNQSHLFDDEVDSPEWDFMVKFWGVITEHLFHGTKLRLKWSDTHLIVHDTVSNLLLKVDLRILQDRILQRYNIETDIGIFEAAEKEP